MQVMYPEFQLDVRVKWSEDGTLITWHINWSVAKYEFSYYLGRFHGVNWEKLNGFLANELQIGYGF